MAWAGRPGGLPSLWVQLSPLRLTQLATGPGSLWCEDPQMWTWKSLKVSVIITVRKAFSSASLSSLCFFLDSPQVLLQHQNRSPGFHPVTFVLVCL